MCAKPFQYVPESGVGAETAERAVASVTIKRRLEKSILDCTGLVPSSRTREE